MGLRVGIDTFLAARPDRSQRVALLSNTSALTRDGITSVEALYRYFGSNLVALFAPEHGFFTAVAAGEKNYTTQHPDYGIPIYSLYGDHRKPPLEQLRGIDLLLIDLPDIGVRCYTYLATLKLTLEAAAEAGVAVAVCDRPVPLAGCSDGPCAVPEFFSFVAPCALPLVYGMTQSESAHWLALPHTAIPLESSDEPAPRFVPPSPNICTIETAQLYPMLVFSEAFPQLNCGRNTPEAFRKLSAPWLDAERLLSSLAPDALLGISACVADAHTLKFAVQDLTHIKPVTASFALLRVLTRDYRAQVWDDAATRPEWFDKLYGTDTVRKNLLAE